MTIQPGSQHTSVNAGIGSQGVNNTQWRGNVTGWQHTERSAQRASGGLSANNANSYMADLKNFGSRLNTASSNLLGSGSAFNQMTGSTSNTDAMLVRVMNQNSANSFFNAGGSVDVGVQQLATAQRNEGDALAATATSLVNDGHNHFQIERDGETFDFNVTVNESDSNRTVQQKMADAINRQSQNTGVTASVEYDSQTRESTLALNTRETGEAQGFTIQDNGGNAVAQTGVANVTQAAQNAEYTLNGDARTSASNTVNIGNGLEVTFRETTQEDATVGAAQDTTAINNAIRDMVNNFNQLREAAVNNNSDRGAQNLQNRMDNISSAFGASLSRIGITQNENGYLQIDEKRLASAIQDGSAEDILGGSSSITQRINQVAQTADKNPNSFISRQSRDNANNTINENMFSNIQFNPFQQSFQSHWNTVGMLFSAMM
jgi:flagellar hook-associated protein 2